MRPSTVHVHVTKDAMRHVRKGHPWIYASSVTKCSANGAPGDVAVIHDDKNAFLAIGFYDPESEIRVRVLHTGKPVALNDAFIHARVTESVARRRGIYDDDTDGLRLVYGESDQLPGLIVDQYGDTVVVKLYSSAWRAWFPIVLDAVKACTHARTMVLRLARNVAPDDDAHIVDGRVVVGDVADDGRAQFREHGLTFLCDPVRGQKTGFFLDHRDNRARVGALSSGKRVLNVFSYTGGFSLHAARGGATDIVSVDASAPALDDAARIFAANAHIDGVARARHRTVVDDAFAALATLHRERERFDVVVIDPPSFARKKTQVDGAIHSYGRLVPLGLDVLKDGGHLVLASCTRLIDKNTFIDVVTARARAAGRPLHVEDVTGHPPDHPTTFSESSYLKCVFARA